MLPFVRETLTWAWLYVQHVVIMFYWAWIPGILLAAAVSARYRPALAELTLAHRDGASAFWAALGWGLTSGAGRRGSLETARALWSQGLPDRVVLAYLASSHSLALYSLVLLTVLIGLEFAVGVVLGGLVMSGLLWLMVPARPSAGIPAPDPLASLDVTPRTTWFALLGSPRGWGHILGDVGRYLHHVGLSLIGGLLLGALVLAIDTEGRWGFPTWMGDETVPAALASAFLAPLLSIAVFLAPPGNLIVVSSIWKTWTVTYSGVISFVLMGVLNPLRVWTLVGEPGGARRWLLVLALYVSAAVSGLAVAGLFALLGIPVTHVPWFRDVVDRLIAFFPFTMAGASGSGMTGM